MKNRFKKECIIPGVLSLFLFFSCNFGLTDRGKGPVDLLPETGSLSISIDTSAARTIYPAIDMAFGSFNIAGSGPDGASFSGTEISATSFTEENIIVGTWTITVEGKNSAGTVIMSGTRAVEIVSGVNSITLDIHPLTDDGTFSFNMTWSTGIMNPADTLITSTLTSAAGIIIPMALSPEDGSLSFSGAFSGGYYIWNLKIEEYGKARYLMTPKVIRIISFSETSTTLTLLESDILPLPQVATPEYWPSPGGTTGPQEVTLYCETPATLIKYSTNGSIPGRSGGTEYTGTPITINSTTGLKTAAYSVEEGWIDSDIAEYIITIDGSCTTPTFSPPPGVYYDPVEVTISSNTSGSEILYSDDGTTDPATGGTLLSGNLTLGSGETTLLAVARADVYGDSAYEISDPIDGIYKVTGHVDAPVIDLPTGYFFDIQEVNLSCTTPGAKVYYTLNGLTPTPDKGIEYTGTITIDQSATLKAAAFLADWEESPISEETYDLVVYWVDPDKAVGTYYDEISVELSTTSPGASIFYTTDGTEPDEASGNLYQTGMPILIDRSLNLKTIAFREGWTESSIHNLTYTLKCSDPVIDSQATGILGSDTPPIGFSSSSTGATLYYTLDGTPPLTSNGTAGTLASVTAGQTLKVISHRDGWSYSGVVTRTYSSYGDGADSPSHGSIITDTSPLINWTDVAGAMTYNLEINTTVDFTGPAVVSETGLTDSEYQIMTPLTNIEDYYWRIQAVYSDNSISSYSNTFQFSVVLSIPDSLWPEDSSTIIEKSPVLSWGEPGEAVSYNVRYASTVQELASSSILTTLIPEYQIPGQLSVGDSLYWQVRIIDTNGVFGSWSESFLFSVRPLALGDEYAGGYIFYLDGTGGGLTCSPMDIGTYIEWGGYGTEVGGTSTIIGAGAANTIAIVEKYKENEPFNGLSNYAARICSEFAYDGYSDWFLPSKDELNLIRENLYLQEIGGLLQGDYWSSSEDTQDLAWFQDFWDGVQYNHSKPNTQSVRAVRAFSD